MTQEVSYDLMAFEMKRGIHDRVGCFVENKYKRNLKEHFAYLAYHFNREDELEKAFYYSIEAGDKAKNDYANNEALQHYDNALEIFDRICKTGRLPAIIDAVKEELDRMKKKEKKKKSRKSARRATKSKKKTS